VDVAAVQFHLRDGGALDLPFEDKPVSSSRYTYDPNNPTPAIYGPTTIPGKSRDLSPYDARKDVASFTTTPLRDDLEVVGPVSVDLFVRSSTESVDFYVSLAEVDAEGAAQHVSDGYIRLSSKTADIAADRLRRVTITCWPTARRFKVGGRLRLYVSSACFPRYARNLGTGEPLATATQTCTTQVEILHDASHQSCVNLRLSRVGRSGAMTV
jgi:putative CocE/NonD family hydrolase